MQEYFVDLNEKENRFELTKFVENFLHTFSSEAQNKLNECIKSMNKKQKKKSYKKFKKQKEKVYAEMSSLDLDEFLKNIKMDFLKIIDSKNDESIEEFNKIKSQLEFEGDGYKQPELSKYRNVDEMSDGEIH